MGRHSHNAAEPTPFSQAPRHRGQRSRARRRKQNPVRTGLLASSAALAVGAIGVSSGLLPSPDGSGGFAYRDDAPGRVRAAGLPNTASPQGRGTVSAGRGTSAPAGRGDARTAAPPAAPPAPATTAPPPPAAGDDRAGTPAAPPPPASTTPTAIPSPSPATTVPGGGDEERDGDKGVAETSVLALVNTLRATAGCRPLHADKGLSGLASDFSADMAAREFFEHTDPDGDDPWDRAAQAGVKNLGGENIARGQATAQDVMDAWMDSAGHRANILNCDFKRIGVGAVFGESGPWWTQDFGY